MRKPRASGRAALVSVGWFVAVGLVACLTPYLRPFLLYGDPPPFPMDWFGMAWVMLLLPFVVWNVQQKTSALDMHLGNYSYALYITHWPVIVFMQLLLAPMGLSDKLLTLAVIAAVSISFYLGVDRPSERFRRGLIGGLSAQQLRS